MIWLFGRHLLSMRPNRIYLVFVWISRLDDWIQITTDSSQSLENFTLDKQVIFWRILPPVNQEVKVMTSKILQNGMRFPHVERAESVAHSVWDSDLWARSNDIGHVAHLAFPLTRSRLEPSFIPFPNIHQTVMEMTMTTHSSLGDGNDVLISNSLKLNYHRYFRWKTWNFV